MRRLSSTSPLVRACVRARGATTWPRSGSLHRDGIDGNEARTADLPSLLRPGVSRRTLPESHDRRGHVADGLAISMDIVDVSLILVGPCVSGARLCSIAIGGHATRERNQVPPSFVFRVLRWRERTMVVQLLRT